MKKTKLDRLPMAAAIFLAVLIVAACTIPLRQDERETTSATPYEQAPDPLATKLAECRSVTYEQKDALPECRKVWAEKRRQFLGQTTPAPSDSRMPPAGSSLFVSPKDESRLPSGFPSIQQTGKE
jgi:conjugative transfer region protein TrbK